MSFFLHLYTSYRIFNLCYRSLLPPPTTLGVVSDLEEKHNIDLDNFLLSRNAVCFV